MITAHRVDAIVHGKVQGVGYRAFARRTAESLGIGGWVKNQWDGSVRIYAVGGKPALELFLKMLRDGPPRARISHIESEWSDDVGDESESFHIR